MDEPAGASTASVTKARPRSGWARTFQALGYRDFRILWVTTMMVAGGVWLQQVSLGWLAYDLTRSPLQVGAILGVRSAPLLLAPIAGVLADRLDRRRMLMVDQALVTALVLGFAVVLFLGLEQVWHLYVFSALFGLLWAVNNPVRQTLVANSVPREALMNATALNSMAFNSMRAIGPAVGGVFIAFFGPALNFLIQGIMFLGVLAMLTQYRPSYGTADRKVALRQSAFRNLADGFRYVSHEPALLAATAATFLLAFTMLSIVFNQMPVYTAEVLNDDEGAVLGILLMAMGVGGLVGTMIIARFSEFERKGLQTIGAFVGAGLSIVVLSQVSNLWLAMGVLAVQQMFTQIVMTTNLTIVQSTARDEMRGRVTGVYQMEIGMLPIGGVIAGAIASEFGVANAFLTGGVAGLVLIVLVALFVPRLRELRL